jgi:putative oxidoreductase
MSATSITSASAPRRRIGTWVLQGVVATAFLAAGAAKLAGVAYMVQLFDQIGVGQWFRYVTGAVEVVGALALVAPGLVWLGGLWLGGTMFFAVLTHVFVLHTSPVPAIVLGVLNALIVYLRRDELASFAKILAKVL